MANAYIITPYDPALWEDVDNPPTIECDLHIFFSDFIKAMKQSFTVERAGSFSWEIFHQNNPAISGGLIGDDYQIIRFYAYDELIFRRFVIWYRSYIPDKYPLYLFIEGFLGRSSANEMKLHLNLSTNFLIGWDSNNW